MKNAVGFYWTLPVPWAGFTALPEDIDAAAEVSRTIRYQRELIRRHADEGNYRLVAERAFLEIEPDRGSEYVIDALQPLEAICRTEHAVLLLVDFGAVHGWRSHRHLSVWLKAAAQRAGIEVEALYPDEVLIDGAEFDPSAHFSGWRMRQREWIASKDERVAKAHEAAQRLHSAGKTFESIAKDLTKDAVRSATGKPWTADSVRKLLFP